MAGHSDNVLDLPRFEAGTTVLIVIAPYYKDISEAQLASARAKIEAAGCTHETIEVPGSLELPTAIAMANRMGDYQGFVALGCVIRGRTSHYDVVVNQSANAIAMLGLQGLCIGNGIITVESREQAEERADANRLDTAGAAAEAALHLMALERDLHDRKRDSGFGFTGTILAKGGDTV